MENERWIETIAQVRFDLEEGQVVEKVYPSNFMTGELKALGYLSIPDAVLFGEEGKEFYSFLLRLPNHPELHCYCSFEQKRAPEKARGFC